MTKQDFIDGKQFYYQTAEHITYVFRLDTGETSIGCLVPLNDGTTLKSVYNIGNDGFRVIINRQPKFIAYSECHLVQEGKK